MKSHVCLVGRVTSVLVVATVWAQAMVMARATARWAKLTHGSSIAKPAIAPRQIRVAAMAAVTVAAMVAVTVAAHNFTFIS